jgi:hypothetical protein
LTMVIITISGVFVNSLSIDISKKGKPPREPRGR